jgi:uncharacterized membrane protein
MKKNFLTGLAILLPIALTLWILFFLINLLTHPFMGMIKGILNTYQLWNTPLGPNAILLISKIAVLLTLFLVTLLIGFFARRLFIRAFVHLMDVTFHRIPIVNKVYKASKEVVHSLFSDDKKTFSQVVLVPFPNSKSICMGMISSPLHPESDPKIAERIAVFVPGTPNPTVGFMVFFRREQLTLINTTVEEAFKFIISVGSLPVPMLDSNQLSENP